MSEAGRQGRAITRRGFLGAVGAGAGSAMALATPFATGMAKAQTMAGPTASGVLTVAGVAPDQALDNEWVRYGDTSGLGGWAGSDGTYTTRLPDGRIAWMFNDTFLGPVNKNGSLPADAGFIHNSIVVADHHRLTTVIGGTPEHPQSLVGPTSNPPTPDPANRTSYWYWNDDGIVDGGKLRLFEAKIVPTNSPPPFDFAWSGEMDIASFSLPDLRLESVTPTYSQDGVNWGTQLLDYGPYIYVYGTLNGLRVARARRGQLMGQWEFYTGTGWSADPTSSEVIIENVGTGGMTPVGGQFVYTYTPGLIDPTIYVYTAPSPVGPFSAPTAIYRPPEASGNIYTYNVAAHPELSRRPDRLVISYNVNSFQLSDLYSDINNNRPRFLELEFKLS
jgi:hypothetical protein